MSKMTVLRLRRPNLSRAPKYYAGIGILSLFYVRQKYSKIPPGVLQIYDFQLKISGQ